MTTWTLVSEHHTDDFLKKVKNQCSIISSQVERDGLKTLTDNFHYGGRASRNREGIKTFFLKTLLLLRHYRRIENINNKNCFIFYTPPPFPLSFSSSSTPSQSPPPSPISPTLVHPLSPRFTSHSDQCLLRRTWLNSDEKLCALLTNHTWKPRLPHHLHIFLSLSAFLILETY